MLHHFDVFCAVRKIEKLRCSQPPSKLTVPLGSLPCCYHQHVQFDFFFKDSLLHCLLLTVRTQYTQEDDSLMKSERLEPFGAILAASNLG